MRSSSYTRRIASGDSIARESPRLRAAAGSRNPSTDIKWRLVSTPSCTASQSGSSCRIHRKDAGPQSSSEETGGSDEYRGWARSSSVST